MEGSLIYARISQVTSWLETLGVAVIVTMVFAGGAACVYQAIAWRNRREAVRHYRAQIGRSIQLGLEILVAADIIRTVTVEATLTSVVSLGLLVLIRTFLSWSISVEMDGRWPWQGRSELSDREWMELKGVKDGHRRSPEPIQ